MGVRLFPAVHGHIADSDRARNPVWRPRRAGSGWVMALNFAAVWRAALARRRSDPALEARDGPSVGPFIYPPRTWTQAPTIWLTTASSSHRPWRLSAAV